MIKIIVLFICLYNLCFSSITFNNETKHLYDFKIDYFFDASKQLTINEISKTDFKLKTNNQFAFGYIKGNNWFKFNIINKSDKDRFILHFNEALLEKVNFYTFQDNKWKMQENGFIVGLDKKNIKRY